MVAPPDGRGAALLLARAAAPEQAAHIGSQTGGRVAFFLHTTNYFLKLNAEQEERRAVRKLTSLGFTVTLTLT